MSNTKTALATFLERRTEIAKRATRLISALDAYDREISGAPLGHSDWGHAGTLEAILESLTNAEQVLASARQATSERTKKRK